MDKVLPSETVILLSFNVKTFTQVDLPQIWMNFQTFSSSSRVNFVIGINFNNLGAVHKGWKLW